MSAQALSGLRVLVLRPEHQAADLRERLEAEGAEVVAASAVEILPPSDWSKLDAALDEIQEFDWLVFTSVNGVESVLERCASIGVALASGSAKIAAIGPATWRALEARSVLVDWAPSAFTTRILAAEFPGPPSRVCLFRADVATPELEKALETRGFEVKRVNAYRTQSADPDTLRAASERINSVAFTSASIVNSFCKALGSRVPAGMLVCSIGPATSRACRRNGLTVDVEAKEHTIPGLVDALKEFKLTAKPPG